MGKLIVTVFFVSLPFIEYGEKNKCDFADTM
jgi:hypothetical protein